MRVSRIAVLRRIRGYTRASKGSLLLLLLSTTAALPVTLLSPRFFQILIDDVMTQGETERFRIVVVGLLLVYVLRFLLDGVKLYSGNRLLNRFTLQLRADVLERVLRAPFSRQEKAEPGDLKMRLMDDVDKLGNFLDEQVAGFLYQVLLAGFSLYMAARIHVGLMLVCLAVLPPVFLLNRWIGRGTRLVNEDTRTVTEAYYASTHNSLQYWQEIKVNNAEGVFLDRFYRYRDQLARLGMRYIRYWACQEVFTDFKANYLTRVLVYVIGAFAVMRGELTVGTLVLFSEYFAYLFGALNSINEKNVALRVHAPYIRRVFETLDFPDGEGESAQAPVLSGALEVKGLSFAYRQGQPVLRGIDLRIEQGERVAIVGKTGCGKTTLLKLLVGLYEPTAGIVTCDGVPVTALSQDARSRQIGVVMQDPCLFNMSIRENLRLAKAEASEDELLTACRRAQIDDFIRGLPDGLDTVIGERGVKLSGGQKQRLAIAAALLKAPRILLLDEATSALDRVSEESVYAAIRSIARDMTVIVVTHKPSAIRLADRVIVLDGGRVTAAGTQDRIGRNAFDSDRTEPSPA